MSSTSGSKVLNLRNLPWECTEEELVDLCNPFGKIVNTKCNVGANCEQAFVAKRKEIENRRYRGFSVSDGMPQAKISAFFKPSSPHPPPVPPPPLEIEVTYTRRHPNPETTMSDFDGRQLVSGEIEKKDDRIAVSSLRSDPASKLVNRKRSYAQYHLELGQSDFLLHTCSVCGLSYARGDEGDEKVHKTFHKSYYEGIQFKGWRSERVVCKPSCSGDRILLVLDCDPPAQKRKVQEIIKMMEKELGFGDDQLLHKLCKVYLFISRHRIVGCLVAEPIKKAHRVISSSSSCQDSDDISHKLAVADTESMRSKPTIQFGGFSFKREVIKRSCSARGSKVDQWDTGAILCEEEAVLAVCGFRAIWVVPSHRRKGIASQLLDVARKSFYNNKLLDHSQCAFSPPTSGGKALASSFSSSNSFLVYMAEDV